MGPAELSPPRATTAWGGAGLIVGALLDAGSHIAALPHFVSTTVWALVAAFVVGAAAVVLASARHGSTELSAAR